MARAPTQCCAVDETRLLPGTPLHSLCYHVDVLPRTCCACDGCQPVQLESSKFKTPLYNLRRKSHSLPNPLRRNPFIDPSRPPSITETILPKPSAFEGP